MTRVAHTGKLYLDALVFSASASAVLSLSNRTIGGRMSPDDYHVLGLPIVRMFDTLTIDTAADDEDYWVDIFGKRYSINAGTSATVGSIRDDLKTELDIYAAAAGFSTANSGADGLRIAPLVPGKALATAVGADTPANISLATSLDTALGNVGIVYKGHGIIEARANAAITARYDLAFVG